MLNHNVLRMYKSDFPLTPAFNRLPLSKETNCARQQGGRGDYDIPYQLMVILHKFEICIIDGHITDI